MRKKGKIAEKTHVYIDGYNLINSWGEIKKHTLEASRIQCLANIIEYKALSGYEVYLVFDAYQVGNKREKQEVEHGVAVVFTKEFQTADSYIEIEVKKIADDKRNLVKVVTSDYAEQQNIFGSGAMRLPPREFIFEYERLKNKVEVNVNMQKNIDVSIGSSLSEEVREKLSKIK